MASRLPTDAVAVQEAFAQAFPNETPLVIAEAPGRVNLIGEHTDYQEGYVFPAAINRKTVVALATNDSGNYKMVSANIAGAKGRVEWTAATLPTTPPERPEWWCYVLGAMRMYCAAAGTPFPRGFSLFCTSSVPLGAGLSSSAALEVATATAMEAASVGGRPIDPLVKARDVCQKAEHVWAKVPCGLMDQAIAVMAKAGTAMLFDCKTQVAAHAPLPPSLRILIVNSGITHALAGGEYAKRKDACQKAVDALQKSVDAGAGNIKSLRGVTPEQLQKIKEQVDATVFRRATHVMNENIRSLEFKNALAENKMQRAGEIMYAGHESLKSLYDVTVPETDHIVEVAKNTAGVVGARMTGGGFGGSVCVLVEADSAENAKSSILTEYKKFFESRRKSNEGHFVLSEPIAFIAEPSAGASIVVEIQ